MAWRWESLIGNQAIPTAVREVRTKLLRGVQLEHLNSDLFLSGLEG